MSDITYSRAYLRGIPEQLGQKRKQEMKRQLVGSLLGHVTAAASSEKTSYMVDEVVYAPYKPSIQKDPHRMGQPAKSWQYPCQDVTLTDDEILGALSEKFPDCVVSFQETWVDTSHNTRVLKKGILIDWS
jgi:hypothetical protein